MRDKRAGKTRRLNPYKINGRITPIRPYQKVKIVVQESDFVPNDYQKAVVK